MRGARFLLDDENAPAMRQAQARRRVVVAASLREAVPIVADEVVQRVVLQRDFLNVVGSPPGGYAEAAVVRDVDGGMRLYSSTSAGGPPPTGTGFRHITAGVEDAAAKLVEVADMASVTGPTAIGRTSGVGTPAELTPAQITSALVDLFTSVLKGAVPASGGGTANFLRADGTWAAPPGGGGGTATIAEVDLGTAATGGTFAIADGAITSTSKVLIWQAPGPYTGKGSLADVAELEQVQIIAAVPGTGVVVVKWQAPPIYIVKEVQGTAGRPNKGVVQTQVGIGQKPQQLVRAGKVGGYVKFCYVVFS